MFANGTLNGTEKNVLTDKLSFGRLGGRDMRFDIKHIKIEPERE